MKKFFITISIVISMISVIYFMAVFAKALSYKWFYQDKVKETVTEMVKSECLFIPGED